VWLTATRDKSFKKMTKEMWDTVMNVDLDGVFLVTKQFIDPMAERGWGRIINISSVIGEVGKPKRWSVWGKG
jgi:NAD(P)-dependent dehydrogenase (short-subunit alcohol dehydrogenase family)